MPLRQDPPGKNGSWVHSRSPGNYGNADERGENIEVRESRQAGAKVRTSEPSSRLRFRIVASTLSMALNLASFSTSSLACTDHSTKCMRLQTLSVIEDKSDFQKGNHGHWAGGSMGWGHFWTDGGQQALTIITLFRMINPIIDQPPFKLWISIDGVGYS